MSVPTIAIIGTGIGGTELAGFAGLVGCRVRVHDIRPEAVAGIRERGGLQVEGVARGFAPVECATTRLAEAVEGAELVVVATLNNHHGSVAGSLGPLLRAGQTVCLMPGCIGGSLEFRRALGAAGCRARITLGEIDNFPFTGAIHSPARVCLASVKRQFKVAALPASDTPTLVRLLRNIFPQIVAADDVLEVGLSSVNPVVHVPGMLANAGRIESGQPFDFYGEGITPAVARLVEALDAERVAVAEAFGYRLPPLRVWLTETYGVTGPTLYHQIQEQHRQVFKHSPAPERLDHRYVDEDVPYGLVPLAGLGRFVGVPTPVTDALTDVASAALGRDFRAEGRTLERMGLSGRTLAELRVLLGT